MNTIPRSMLQNHRTRLACHWPDKHIPHTSTMGRKVAEAKLAFVGLVDPTHRPACCHPEHLWVVARLLGKIEAAGLVLSVKPTPACHTWFTPERCTWHLSSCENN